jgi:hypothetical protein
MTESMKERRKQARAVGPFVRRCLCFAINQKVCLGAINIKTQKETKNVPDTVKNN